jgi:hypothetical protein
MFFERSFMPFLRYILPEPIALIPGITYVMGVEEGEGFLRVATVDEIEEDRKLSAIELRYGVTIRNPPSSTLRMFTAQVHAHVTHVIIQSNPLTGNNLWLGATHGPT